MIIKKIAWKEVLAFSCLVIMIAASVTTIKSDINYLAIDGLTSPQEAQMAAAANLRSATPCLHGRQLIIFKVINPAGTGTTLDELTQQVIELTKQGAIALIPFHGLGPLTFTFEIQVSEFPGDLANADSEQVVLSAFGGTSSSAYMTALEYANQRKAEGWDGVALAILPNAVMVKENWGWAYVNGPYLWFPTKAPAFYWDGQLHGQTAALVFAHELLHHYGALDLYGSFNPEARSGVDLVANGPREQASGIMRYLPNKLSDMTLAEVTQGQVFGLDDNSNGWRNPLDVVPELQVSIVSEDVTWQASGGSYQPKNTALPTIQITKISRIEVWKKAGENEDWKLIANPPNTIRIVQNEELVIKAVNTAGNQAIWCSNSCPDPWPGNFIYLPLVFK